MPVNDIAPWLLGTLMALLSLLGLALASAAADQAFYFAGLGFFLFGVRFTFGLIHRYVGRCPCQGVRGLSRKITPG